MKRVVAPRGFSLVELCVAMAIAGVITASAASASMLILKNMKQTEQQTLADQEAKLLGEYVVSRLQGIGGGSVRPWHGIRVEAGPNGSEMLTWMEVDEDIPTCIIVARPGSGAVLRSSTDASGDCCLTGAFGNRELLAVLPGGSGWESIHSNNVNMSSCQVNFPPGHGKGASYNLPGDNNNWVGGSVSVVRVYRLRIDEQNQLLYDADDADGSDADGVNDGWDTTVVADNVFDLQFALGYDVNGDGRLFSNGTANDEWHGNHASDAIGSGGLQDAAPNQLRMLEVGFVTGTPVSGLPARPVSTMNGPARSRQGFLLRPVSGRAFLRNLNIFF